MNYEKSCGAVVYTKINNEMRYLLIQNLEGIYGFPKGHMESDETEIETAIREIKEEVSLDIKLCDKFRTTDSHLIPQKENTMKEIVYFIGYYENQTPVYQKEELTSASLYTYDEAMSLFQFESLKRILTEANDFLKGKQYLAV